jgi:2-polyprenyl-3-methyl-5-hydroxy-6-metoxy-1,4-benzoquinol methylase
MKIGTKEWNDEMYKRHATPYSGIAGFIERQRIKRILNMAKVSPSDTLLEVGCESGNLLTNFPPCRRVVGFDISEFALQDANLLFARLGKKAEFVQGDASAPLPFQQGDFSVVVCSEMLEHVPDPRKCLENILGICNKETKIILTVPNEKPKLVIKSILKYLRVFDMLFPNIEENQSEWHLQSFDAAQLRAICEGLADIVTIESVMGLHFLAQCRKSQQAHI